MDISPERKLRRIAAVLFLSVGMVALALGATIKHSFSGHWPGWMGMTFGSLVLVGSAASIMVYRTKSGGGSQ